MAVRGAYLENTFSECQRGVRVEQPAQEELHAHHEGGCERVGLPLALHQVCPAQPKEQGGSKNEKVDPAAVAECMVFLLQANTLISLQQQL